MDIAPSLFIYLSLFNIIIDDAFFYQNWAGACWGRWAGACWGRWAGLELPLGRSLALDATLLAKTSDRGGQQGVCP